MAALTARPAGAAGRRRPRSAARRAGDSSWQAAHSAETSSAPRSCISSMKIAMPVPTSVATAAASVNSSTRSISMSPESARPLLAGTSMPGCQRSRSLGAAPPRPVGAERCANALSTPRTSSIRSGARCRGASSRTAMCSAAASGRRSDWSGRASILPVPQRRLIACGPQRVEQHGLAHAAQPGEHQAALGPAARDALQHHVEGVQLPPPPGELGRALAGAGRVRVADRIHESHSIGFLAARLDVRRGGYRVSAST